MNKITLSESFELYELGASIKECAEALGMTVNQVKAIEKTAKNKIKRLLIGTPYYGAFSDGFECADNQTARSS